MKYERLIINVPKNADAPVLSFNNVKIFSSQVESDLFLPFQTVVNDVPLDGSVIETQYGVIIVLPQVLKIHRNRCSKEVTLQVNVRMEEVMDG